jgi:hypothetical protein
VVRKDPTPEERKQVEPYLNGCLDFIGMMIGLATTNELEKNERLVLLTETQWQ